MSEPKENTSDQNKSLNQATASSQARPTDTTTSVDEKLDQANNYLAQLVYHDRELTDTVSKQQQNLMRQQRSWKTYLRHMAIEVPPVVLAVLLAFGINSWWQQQKVEQLAAQSLDNIIAETRVNLGLYEQVIRLDQRNLKRLNRQIDDVKAGIVHLDTLYGAGRGYGQGVNTFVMQEGAWQAATLTGGVTRFSPDLLQDASEMYSRIHYRNVDHAGFETSGYERYREEILLASLLENREMLRDHISNCTYDMTIIRSFLEKYDLSFQP